MIYMKSIGCTFDKFGISVAQIELHAAFNRLAHVSRVSCQLLPILTDWPLRLVQPTRANVTSFPAAFTCGWQGKSETGHFDCSLIFVRPLLLNSFHSSLSG